MKKITILLSLFATLLFNSHIVKAQCEPITGIDDQTCGLSYSLNGTLSSGSSTCEWTTLLTPTGGNATFQNSINYNTNVTVNIYGIYEFILTETNGACTDSDTIEINFLETPTANAGPAQTLCGTSVNLDADITAWGTGYSGLWSTTDPLGNGTYYEPTPIQPNPTATFIWPNGETNDVNVTYTWTVSNGECSTSDDVTITFEYADNINNPGDVNYTCLVEEVEECYTLQALTTPGHWTIPSGFTSIATVSDLNEPNAELCIDQSLANWGDTSNIIVPMMWTTSGGNCAVDAIVDIYFFLTPTANAGVDTGVCGYDHTLNAIYSINGSDGLWNVDPNNLPAGATPGSVTFGDGTQEAQESNIVDIHVTLPGVYYFIWEEMNTARPICSHKDTVMIEFIQIPNPNAGSDIVVCDKWTQLNADTYPNATSSSWLSAPIVWVEGYGSTTEDLSQQLQPNAYIYNLGLLNSDLIDTVQLVWQNNIQGAQFPTVQCETKDTMEVSFVANIPAENQTNVPAENCGPYIYLASSQTMLGESQTGYWIDSAGAVLNWWTNPAYNIEGNGTTTYAEVDLANTDHNAFAFVVQNGGTFENPVCVDTSNFTTALFHQLPQVNACENCEEIHNISLPNVNGVLGYSHFLNAKIDTVCLNENGVYLLNGYHDVGIGTWSRSSNGIIFSNTDTVVAPLITHVANDTVTVSNFNSTTGNPVGDYYLLIWRAESSNIGCSSQDTLLVRFNENTNSLNGVISHSGGNFNENEIKVELYTSDVQNGYQLSYVSETNIDANSHFDFSNIDVNNYTLRTVLQQGNYPEVVNTYYNSVLNWEDATYINLTCSDSVDASFAVQELGTINGICTFSGIITYEGENKNTNGQPVTGAEVYIEQEPNDEPISRSTTADNGTWEISQIPVNNEYRLSVDIPGIPLISTHSNLLPTSSNLEITSLNFIVDTTSGGGIYTDTTTSIIVVDNIEYSILIFPNPTNSFINIKTSKKLSENISINIINVEGKHVYSIETKQKKHIIDISKYNNGVYFIKLIIDNTVYLKKFIKN